MSGPSYAHLAPATVILGGASTLTPTASGEFSTPGAQAASLLGGFAVLGILVLLWWVNIRAARYKAWASGRYPASSPCKGGFSSGSKRSRLKRPSPVLADRRSGTESWPA